MHLLSFTMLIISFYFSSELINADKSYVITYSQTGDYDRMEEYEASAETIRVEN